MKNLKRYRTLFVLAAVLLCICIPVVASAATVTFLDGVNDVAFEPISTEAEIGSSVQVPVSNPSREGYTYDGWNPSPYATQVPGDITFVAKWTKKGPNSSSAEPVYMVVYRDGANKAVFTDDEHDVYYTSTDGAVTPAFSYPDKLLNREGYKFKGWKYQLNGVVQSECLTELPETVTGYTVYTAQWEVDPDYKPEQSQGIIYYPDYDESPEVTPVPTPTPEPVADEENTSPKTGAAEVSLPALAIVALAAMAMMVRAFRKRAE